MSDNNPLIDKSETLDSLVSSGPSVAGEDGGTGGGLVAEADEAVKVSDFATADANAEAEDDASDARSDKGEGSSRAPTPPSRIDTPTNKQAWDDFLDQYVT
jgi:hypothetical protein